MISGMKCSPVAPLKWRKSRPTSAATSRKIGALNAGPRGAEKMLRGTPASARLVSSMSRRDSFAAIGQQATGGKRRGSMRCPAFSSMGFRLLLERLEVPVDAGEKARLAARRGPVARFAEVMQSVPEVARPPVGRAERVEITRRGLILRLERL